MKKMQKVKSVNIFTLTGRLSHSAPLELIHSSFLFEGNVNYNIFEGNVNYNTSYGLLKNIQNWICLKKSPGPFLTGPFFVHWRKHVARFEACIHFMNYDNFATIVNTVQLSRVRVHANANRVREFLQECFPG